VHQLWSERITLRPSIDGEPGFFSCDSPEEKFTRDKENYLYNYLNYSSESPKYILAESWLRSNNIPFPHTGKSKDVQELAEVGEVPPYPNYPYPFLPIVQHRSSNMNTDECKHDGSMCYTFPLKCALCGASVVKDEITGCYEKIQEDEPTIWRESQRVKMLEEVFKYLNS